MAAAAPSPQAMDQSTLEYILDPAKLEAELTSGAKTDEDHHLTLKRLLQVLQTEKARFPAAARPTETADGITTASNLKELYLLKMALQVASHLAWDLKVLDSFLPIGLQQQLMDALLQARLINLFV